MHLSSTYPRGVATCKHFHVQPSGTLGNLASREAGTGPGQTRGAESKEQGCSPVLGQPQPSHEVHVGDESPSDPGGYLPTPSHVGT